jgi:tetratricopeptide (TPR) repeat protein
MGSEETVTAHRRPRERIGGYTGESRPHVGSGIRKRAMETKTDEIAVARRRLIVRDSLALLSLVAATLALFGITLLLFRSFSAHRADLAKRWSARGAQAMKAGHPQQAITALRTALGYAPDTRQYELLLAQALGEAGHLDESYNYFMGLWETQPGDGFINLELARLAARRGDVTAAVEFYRASIYGTWEGDGVARRSEVRLELARYLIQRGQYAPARVELLIAGGNVAGTEHFDATVAELLVDAQDPADARNYYAKALAAAPNNPDLLERAGRLAYASADYETARRLLSRAIAARAQAKLPAEPGLDALRADAARLLELAPSPDLPVGEAAGRVLLDSGIAKRRLETCVAQYDGAGGQLPSVLQDLATRWTAAAPVATWRTLRRDSATQNAMMRLVYDTELVTAKVCKPASADDALLLMLAQANAAAESPSPAPLPPAAQAPVQAQAGKEGR